ncbi:unnamed protein product [Protopolystoma xenopodis]|uniref:Uncharacterized protein n=1 Tax=Protopolystoma xenopodis TaxID=117903 RepID=A0A3S5FFT9_9PLAT|nr:unnamed protein product [Protopolystoma xenopodis]
MYQQGSASRMDSLKIEVKLTRHEGDICPATNWQQWFRVGILEEPDTFLCFMLRFEGLFRRLLSEELAHHLPAPLVVPQLLPFGRPTGLETKSPATTIGASSDDDCGPDGHECRGRDSTPVDELYSRLARSRGWDEAGESDEGEEAASLFDCIVDADRARLVPFWLRPTGPLGNLDWPEEQASLLPRLHRLMGAWKGHFLPTPYHVGTRISLSSYSFSSPFSYFSSSSSSSSSLSST